MEVVKSLLSDGARSPPAQHTPQADASLCAACFLFQSTSRPCHAVRCSHCPSRTRHDTTACDWPRFLLNRLDVRCFACTGRLRESMGVSVRQRASIPRPTSLVTSVSKRCRICAQADSSQRAFPSADIEAFKKRTINAFPEDVFGDRPAHTCYRLPKASMFCPLTSDIFRQALRRLALRGRRGPLRRWKQPVRGVQHRAAHQRDRRGGAGS